MGENQITISVREYKGLLQKEIELELVHSLCLMERGYINTDRIAKLLGWKDINASDED